MKYFSKRGNTFHLNYSIKCFNFDSNFQINYSNIKIFIFKNDNTECSHNCCFNGKCYHILIVNIFRNCDKMLVDLCHNSGAHSAHEFW